MNSALASGRAIGVVADNAHGAPLPTVKPEDYEDFLQRYLHVHPSFGYSKLLKVLEGSMHVTCSQRSMRTWFSHHDPVVSEPTIAEHEDFLLLQLVAKPDIGYKALCKRVLKERGVAFREATYQGLASITQRCFTYADYRYGLVFFRSAHGIITAMRHG